MHAKRFIGLFAAAATVGATGLTPAALAAGKLQGSGSTLVQPLMAQWSNDYQGRTGVEVDYGGIGSGGGIKNITNNVGDFGASDAPLNAQQAAACPQCVQIPWALTATALGYHINGLRGLKLNSDVIARIYLGQITNWSDARIAKLNKGLPLPNLAITPVHRSDSSGDTYAFTDYLSRASSSWAKQVGFGTTVTFPAGVGQPKNAGVTQAVISTNGAIGYISASYLISAGLPAVAIQNKAGQFVKPNLANIKAAAKAVHGVPANNELHIVNPPKSAKTAYPISTFTYVIARHDGAQKSLLKDFINYVLGPGQAFGPVLDFSALPSVVKNADLRAVASL